MAVDIVREIIEESKSVIAALLPEYSQLPYEYDILKNSDRDNSKGFGFIPLDADFTEGRSLGYSSMAHRFQIILTEDYSNYSDDTELETAIKNLYKDIYAVVQDFVAKKLVLPSSAYQVLLVRGLSIEEPEFFEDNKLVALKARVEMQYRFRNN